MLSGMDEFEQNGIAAAGSYLERAGFAQVESAASAMCLTAVDSGERVFVFVTVSRGFWESVVRTALSAPEGYDRVDTVDVLVIASDRALLRHQRGVGSD